MKSYKKVEMVAKNAPSGSYAAGCPTELSTRGGRSESGHYCEQCEVAR